MLSYCFNCRKKTDSKNSNIPKVNKGKLMFYQSVQCMMVKNQDLSKKKKASGILSTLGLKRPLSGILALGDTLF